MKTLLAFLLITLQLQAAVVCALGPADNYKPAQDDRPSPDALALAKQVSTALKSICGAMCPLVALFRNPTAPNATLIVVPSDAKLVYSPQFFRAVHDSFGDDGVVAVVAHEMGHALDDVLGAQWIRKEWSPELRADAWGACALAKTSAGPSALAALSKYPSPAHPVWNVRMPVIRAGYTQCGGNWTKLQK